MVHSVDILEEAIEVAKRIGFEVRHEWLNESRGGLCRIGDRWMLFVDLSLTAAEQLEQVVGGLKHPDYQEAIQSLGPNALSGALSDALQVRLS
ncbi:MAG: hypothetical protein Aurels2KO_39760 [Aureliella sp.]